MRNCDQVSGLGRKLRLCYLASTPIPSRNAYSVHVMKMCQAFVSADCMVRLITPNMSGIVESKYTEFEYYNVKPSFEHIRGYWPSRIKGRAYIHAVVSHRLVRQFQPDFVYGRFLAGIYRTALSKIPVALEMHAPIVDAGMASERLFRQLIKRREFRQLVVISNSLANWYIENYPSLSSKLTIAHDGADLVDKSGQLLFSNDGFFEVGYVGHLYEGKGVEIIEQIAPMCPWARFHVIGGTEEDIAYWKRRLQLVNVVMHGYKPYAETRKYQESFDVVLAPYQDKVRVCGGLGDVAKWMSPLKIFEYMASGTAIVASDLSVLQEILRHEYTAILCAPRDIDDWAKQLRRLKEDEQLRLALGVNARNEFEEKYTWSKRAERLSAAIDSWL